MLRPGQSQALSVLRWLVGELNQGVGHPGQEPDQQAPQAQDNQLPARHRCAPSFLGGIVPLRLQSRLPPRRRCQHDSEHGDGEDGVDDDLGYDC